LLNGEEMKIGFTGTRKAITKKQIETLLNTLRKYKIEEAHHGGCVGADSVFHLSIKNEDAKNIVVHPGDEEQYDTYSLKALGEKPDWKVLDTKPYLERNKDIVDCSDLLIVMPSTFKEELRSGTWSTYRYAKKKGKEIIIIYPDGENK